MSNYEFTPFIDKASINYYDIDNHMKKRISDRHQHNLVNYSKFLVDVLIDNWKLSVRNIPADKVKQMEFLIAKTAKMTELEYNF